MTDKKEGQHPENQDVPDADENGQGKKIDPTDPYASQDRDGLIKMHREAVQKLTETTEEKKQYEVENQAYKNWYNQQVSQQYQQPQQSNQFSQQHEQPSGDAGGEPDFWSNPSEATKRMFQQNLSQYDKTRRTSDAMRYAPMAERMAVSQAPEVFEDVDINMVRQNLMGGLQAGIIAPELVSNPETWVRTAWLLKGDKAGYKFPKTQKGSSPADLETPDATKKQAAEPDGSLPMNETIRSLMKGFGMTKKEAIETIQGEKKDRGEI